MTDEQLLRRLAEIEGVAFAGQSLPKWMRGKFVVLDGSRWRSWNPLTNWSDLGPLIEKYKPEMVFLEEDAAGPDEWRVELDLWYFSDKSLPRAICLAIVMAHE